jgi:Rv2258c-like winged HTH domain
MSRIVGYMTGGAACFGILLGDELGLYSALTRNGARGADEVAAAASCNPQLTREWLDGQAAAGLVDYDAETDTYSLSPEARNDARRRTLPGVHRARDERVRTMFRDMERSRRRSPRWRTCLGDHDPCLFKGTE